MESDLNQTPLIVIVGQTASGKSALALELAQQFNGEIICADSRTVYKGMDIATAKPTKKERQLVPHHLLDIAAPNQPVTAAVFKQKAQQAIMDIAARGKVPFLVGGTGLYVDAVLYDFSFAPVAPTELHEQLAGKSVEELQELLRDSNIVIPKNEKNPRHLIRQLETGGAERVRRPLRANTLILGLEFVEPKLLKKRLTTRLDQMFKQGLLKEVRNLVNVFGWECPSLQAIGYQEFEPYFINEIDLETVETTIVQHSLQYAKRQKTWFKRNPHIHWICKKAEAVDLITSHLNKNYIGQTPSLLQ